MSRRPAGERSRVSASPPAAGLVEALPDAIVAVDGRRRIVFVNAEAERMFGCSRRQLLGQPVERFVPPEAWPPAPAATRNRRGTPSRRRKGARDREGRTPPMKVRVGTLATSAGRVTIAAIRAADPEPETPAPAASAPEAALVELSHDLRNSLGVIGNATHYLGILLPGDPRVRKHLDLVQREVATSIQLLRRLLTDRPALPVGEPHPGEEAVRLLPPGSPAPETRER